MLISLWADTCGLASQLPLRRNSDKCFVVNCFVLGHFAEVISAKAAEQNAKAVLSKLQNRTFAWFCFSSPSSHLLVGDPGCDYLTVQLTPNTNS